MMLLLSCFIVRNVCLVIVYDTYVPYPSLGSVFGKFAHNAPRVSLLLYPMDLVSSSAGRRTTA